MKIPGILKARLDRLANRHGWTDFDLFSRPGLVFELPLYSRYQEIRFLEEFDRRYADEVTVSYGLDAIDTIVRLVPFQEPFFLALTLERADPASPIVPKLFLCHRADCDRLGDHLRLGPPKGSLSRRVLSILADRADTFQVKQEDVTVPGQPRIFVAHRHSQVDNQRTLESLVNQHDSAGSRA